MTSDSKEKSSGIKTLEEAAARTFWDLRLVTGIPGQILIYGALVGAFYAYFFPESNAGLFILVSQLSALLFILLAVIALRFKKGEEKKLQFFLENWKAQSSEGLENHQHLPVSPDFETVFFTVDKSGSFRHWRAGVTFYGKGSVEYIFHIYEDESDPGKLKTRIIHRKPGREIIDTDRRFTFAPSTSVDHVEIEVKKIRTDVLRFVVNGTEVGDSTIPLEQIQALYLGAWADGVNPYDIIFRDIKVTPHKN